MEHVLKCHQGTRYVQPRPCTIGAHAQAPHFIRLLLRPAGAQGQSVTGGSSAGASSELGGIGVVHVCHGVCLPAREVGGGGRQAGPAHCLIEIRRQAAQAGADLHG